MAKLTKDKMIEKRVAELTETYSSLSENQMKLALPLIKNASFIEVEMEELANTIAKEGVYDEYKNGANQFGKKKSANLQAYNALAKSYIAINQRLEKMLPNIPKGKSRLEELIDE